MQKYYDRETEQQAIFEEMQQCRDLETSRLIVVRGDAASAKQNLFAVARKRLPNRSSIYLRLAYLTRC